MRADPLEAMPVRYPVTPDGRYFVVRGRLWRCADPSLSEPERVRLTRELMHARRAIGHAMRAHDHEAERRARAEVHAAKVALGERGEPWWHDGAPDCNRRMVRNTPYREWFDALHASSARPTQRGSPGHVEAMRIDPG
jgi:hypothetical protein